MEISKGKKDELVFLKSQSGWCFPTSRRTAGERIFLEILEQHFSNWNSISSEDDYYDNIYNLPLQKFIYHAKIQGQGYEIINMP